MNRNAGTAVRGFSDVNVNSQVVLVVLTPDEGQNQVAGPVQSNKSKRVEAKRQRPKQEVQEQSWKWWKIHGNAGNKVYNKLPGQDGKMDLKG